MAPENFDAIIAKLAAGTANAADMAALRLALTTNRLSALQLGKYNINISQGQNVQIGDSLHFPALNEEAMQAIAHHIFQKLQASPQPAPSPTKSVDALVEQVRSRLHDDIQRLHGTMPLWGVDHWVPLGELFVDVNILEELSSSRRSELADLWQDFSQNPSYRSLDRIGLGRERQRVSGLEVLTKQMNLMVVGKPGSGKTTYLQRVVTECNVGNLQAHKIPVLIRLREFVEDGRDIAYSLERYLEQCWQLSATEAQLVLNQGRSLVLLDGLDEVTGDDGKTITKQIKRFARVYPQVQMVVTCRTQSQESRFERFDYVEVSDFNEPQVRAFAEHWFQTVCADQGAGQAKAQLFLDQLFQEENKPIRELAIIPILLSLTCAVFEQKHTFYSKRSKLYEEGLELLLEQWDKSREIERDEIYRDLSVKRKLELLSHLAVKKFEQEQYVLFEQTELEGYISEFLEIGQGESQAVLRAIEAQHGLLIERSQKVWSFSHLTFQEYLVAKRLGEQSDWQNLVRYIVESYWREVFLLTVEMLPSPNTFLWLMKAETDQFLAENKELQQFLVWVNEKSLSVNSPYKRSVVRAFYYDLTLGFELANDGAAKLAYNTALDSDLSLPLALCPDFVLNFDLNGDCAFTHNDFDLASDYLLQCTLFLIIDRVIEIVYEVCKSSQVDSKFKRRLHQLLNELPEEQEEFDEWLGECESEWFDELRSIVIEYRNIGHYWQFTEAHINFLQKYYGANKLLVDCIIQSSVLSPTVVQQIEEALLLPIAKIEKRKREKAEYDDLLVD